MRFNKIMFLGLLLMAVLAVGAVSASEDVAGDQNLTLADDSSDVLEESVNEEQVISGEDYSQNIYEDGIWVYINDDLALGEKKATLAVVKDSNYINGSVTLSVDGKQVFFNKYSEKNKVDSKYISCEGFIKKVSLGYHTINLTYQKNGVYNPFTVVRDVEFYPYYEVIADGDYNTYSFELVQTCAHGPVNVWFPYDSDPYFDFLVDGKSITKNHKKGCVAINQDSLKVGGHYIEVRFTDKSGKYPSQKDTLYVTVLPYWHYPEAMSIGENDHIILKTTNNVKIKAILYKKDKKTKLCTVYGKKALKINLKKYVKKGDNHFYLVARFGDYKYKDEIYVLGIKNSPKIKVNAKKLDNRVKITIKGPKYYTADYSIAIDGRWYEEGYVYFSNGYYKNILKPLGIGKHKIKVVFLDHKYKFSKTFTVKVKAKDKVSISLNKVKIKKSAKKVVLRSTVKLNKKAKKGLKVTFKFNGKKFTAKTNSKGVAKLTVKSKYYKNLEVGKQTKIEAKYSKTSTKWLADVIE